VANNASTKLVIKFGGYQEPASIHNQAAARFGERLRQRLGGRLDFELIGSIVRLGRPASDLVPMVERGELSFCYMSTVRFSRAAAELQLLELPFVVTDRRVAFRALDGEYGERARRQVQSKSACRLLQYWDNGFRHLTNRVRAIRAPDDCRGLRIRTQTSELHGEVFRALGFEPIASDIKEFIEQIAGDRFQAHDNPLTNIYNFGVHRHHRYITLSGHFWGGSALVCNAAHPLRGLARGGARRGGRGGVGGDRVSAGAGRGGRRRDHGAARPGAERRHRTDRERARGVRQRRAARARRVSPPARCGALRVFRSVSQAPRCGAAVSAAGRRRRRAR
jgi:Bacterial extracellular solute-binding protein, family 7